MAIALALGAPAPALACSIAPPETPPTQAQIDGQLRLAFEAADDLVEYVVVESATSRKRGAIRVTRTFKGRFRAERFVTIWTEDSGLCGAGDAKLGERGRMLLRGRGGKYRYAPMSDRSFGEFVRLGLVPAR